MKACIAAANAIPLANGTACESLEEQSVAVAWSLALLAVDAGDVRTGAGDIEGVLAVIRRLREQSVPVVCYGDHAETWPLSRRCRLLLAGSPMLLDSSCTDFESQLGAELRKRVQVSALDQTADQRITGAAGDLGIVGESAALKTALRAVERSARLSDMPVVLVGESGTGKELLARAVHRLDARRWRQPFIAVNCAALTKTLAEAELFGHRKGVFSGADRERPGFVRAADGGVLFLDEIGELDLDLQAKLLRVIQERCVLVLGDSHETAVDVRVVAATHRDLKAMVAQERFRADLFNRLWVYPIDVPPLRTRRDDIPALVSLFLSKHPRDDRVEPVAGPDFLAALGIAKLDGNVRELENVVQRAIAMAEPDRPLGLSDLPPHMWADLAGKSERLTSPSKADEILVPESGDLNLARAIAHHERLLVETALRESGGNQTKAATLLGITTRSIYNKLSKHRMLPEKGARPSAGKTVPG